MDDPLPLKNNEGRIGVDELGEVMKTMGLDPSKEELQDIIDNADKNGNRKLDFEEFASFMVKKVRERAVTARAGHTIKDVRKMFAILHPPSTFEFDLRCKIHATCLFIFLPLCQPLLQKFLQS